MKNQIAATLLAAAAIAGPVFADGIPSRHFTASPTDTNRNEKVPYTPIGLKVIGQKTIDQPYDVSAASWYLQAPGVRGVRANKVLDKGQYTLERFDLNRPATPGGAPQFNVVIVRRPAPPTADLAELQIVHPESGISVRALPTVENLADGARYTYRITPPAFGFFPTGDYRSAVDGRYEVRFKTARDVRPPASLARLPTFGGEDIRIRSTSPPPRLPAAERVAGKRIEYRNGQVIEERRK